MARRLRLKKLINWTIQGPIIVRLLIHFMAYNGSIVFLLLSIWGVRTSLASITEQPPDNGPLTFWQQATPVLICMVALTPFMIWDLMELTNRIAGPLYRFEILMKDFVKTGTLAPAVLRNGDLVTDFQKQFNEFTEALHALYPETNPAVRGVAECAALPTRVAESGSETEAVVSTPQLI